MNENSLSINSRATPQLIFKKTMWDFSLEGQISWFKVNCVKTAAPNPDMLYIFLYFELNQLYI